MPAGNTYEPIATTTLTATNSTVTFSSIPSIYTDLVLIVNSLGTGAYFSIQVNGDTGTNYSRTRINGNGSTVTSARNASASDIPVDDLSSTVREISILNFQNYSNSTTFKTIVFRQNLTTGNTGATVGLWRSTSAITSISIFTNSSTFAVDSTFTLYGIAAA